VVIVLDDLETPLTLGDWFPTDATTVTVINMIAIAAARTASLPREGGADMDFHRGPHPIKISAPYLLSTSLREERW
jgi:hypothetical protein